jgi:hypothetical protein
MFINNIKYLPNNGKYLIHRWPKSSTQYHGRGTMKWSNIQKMRAFQSFKQNLEGLFAHTPMQSPLEASYDSIVDEPQVSYQGSKLVTYGVNPLIFPSLTT